MSNVPWVEKYRPGRIHEVVGNEEVVARLKVIARDGNMPNLMLSGPPGTGKTTSVMCLARELLGDAYSEAILELNASDERGLDVVRNKIKMFAQKKVTLPVGRHKIVVLDEADSMTSQAQQALRRTMELHSSTTRFALACNTSSKIIEPIQSRCAVVRYTRLSNAQVQTRLLHVARAEGVTFTEDGIEALLFIAEGDLRNALNALQATHTGFELVNAENVFRVCDQPHPQLVETVLQYTKEGNLMGAQKEMSGLLARGYAPIDVMGTFFKVVQNMPSTQGPEGMVQLELLRIIGETHLRMADGCATPLQLAGMVSEMCRARASA